MALSPTKLATLPVGKHHDERGLYLQVREGSKGRTYSWVLRFMLDGRSHDQGLGQARLPGDKDTKKVTLSEAREKRDRERTLLKDRINPLEVKRDRSAQSLHDALKAVTFKQAAQEFMAAKEGEIGKNAEHKRQWYSSLDFVNEIIGKVPVRDIDTNAVLRVMKHDDFWNRARTTAKRTLGRIERVLAYAAVHGYRDANNPARWKGHLNAVLPKVGKQKHHPSLHHSELAGYMDKLTAKSDVRAMAVEWIILTACRLGDVAGQKSDDKPPCLWSHIDMKAKTWTIPATKTDAEHVVPLSGAAMSLLERVRKYRIDERVFPVDPQAIRKAMKAVGNYRDKKSHNPITLHGFRSTFSTWRAECSSFSDELGEAALGHQHGNKAMQAYQHGDLLEKRRALMDAWADFATHIVPSSAKVVRMKGRR